MKRKDREEIDKLLDNMTKSYLIKDYLQTSQEITRVIKLLLKFYYEVTISLRQQAGAK